MRSKLEVNCKYAVYAVPSSDRLILIGYDNSQPCYVDYTQGLEEDSYEALLDDLLNNNEVGEFYYDFFQRMERSIVGDTLVERLDEFFWMWVHFEEAQSDLNDIINGNSFGRE